MKTIETVRNIIATQSVEAFRATLKAMRSNVEQLDTIQSETVRDGGKVSDSVRSYIKAVGLDAAVATVATLVNRDSWDGRISSRNSEWAASVEDALTMSGRFFATINRTAYTGQKDDCMLRCIEWRHDGDVLNDLGGSAYLEEIPGKTITEAGSGRKYRVLTAEEISIILDVVKTAAAAHEKKVEAYLKRYGTSKVHSWTYWRDA